MSKLLRINSEVTLPLSKTFHWKLFASDLPARSLLVCSFATKKERKPVRLPHEPKRRHSSAVKNIRRAAIKLSAIKLVVCPNCNFKTISHMACRNCGYFGGKKVNDEAVKVTRA